MKKLKRFFIYLFLSVAAFVSIFPFLWMLVSMTNKSVDVTQGRLLPGTAFVENLQNLLDQTQIGTAIWNSLIIAVITTFLTLLIGSMAGYGFEIYRSKGKDIVFSVLILSMMIPFAAIMIPLYRLFGQVSADAPLIGLDTLAAALLPTIITAFFIFFFRQNTKMFARDLVEAGRIDGLSEIGIFFRIYLPTMKTTYAAAAIIAFMNSWNNYLWPLVVLQSPEKQTIPLLISNLGAGYTPDYGVIMTAIVIATLPTALVFFLMQRHFVAGMMGSVKG
ncbi:carbohydrate ABC transporter permease [Gracilibacillus caseinilyticus]|uniref:Carbohydrate ABC transporter permease n=1 Tax=Gracilibacillus caseinilyticus TaxID=2932256 RepID=A0ABY4F6K3_9BACI|nr:carbohydrate ABC transporter permease [Gracilibacillus caseinilyticus]UOQ50081.1 carbohydrate ABC transporter permease [Gracilibacillus caseinilyticus]